MRGSPDLAPEAAEWSALDDEAGDDDGEAVSDDGGAKDVGKEATPPRRVHASVVFQRDEATLVDVIASAVLASSLK